MKVSIRRFEKRDIPNKIKWINNPKNNQFLHYDLPLQYNRTVDWFERIKDRTDRYDAVIEVDGNPIGLIGLLSIDYKNRKAEYYIALGETEYKGRGVARIASQMLLDYAFKELRLNKVYLFTETQNIPAQRLFKRVGFRKEGLLKDDIKNEGKLVDRYIYAICKEEYYASEASNGLYLNPTQIHKLSQELKNNNFYIKRDDLIPISFGGNKVRKALLFLEDIKEKQSDCIVTYGSSSSNHCRVIANMAASNGLACFIISPEETKKSTPNSLLVEMMGAQTIYCSVSEVKETIDETVTKLREEGYNPYFIQGGGHGNLGTEAYVNAYKEIMDYQNTQNISFDYIFHASGTGTTQAGLICGKLLNKADTNIVGISIARQNPYGKTVVLESVNSYLSSKDKRPITEEEVEFVDEYILGGYGDFNSEIVHTLQEVFIKDGVPLDTTYTGKAFWGMLEYVKEKQIKNKNILFIHTGGTPLFFDDLGEW